VKGVTIACLATSLGVGGFWAQQHAIFEQPLSDSDLAPINGEGIIASQSLGHVEDIRDESASDSSLILAENAEGAVSSEQGSDQVGTVETVEQPSSDWYTQSMDLLRRGFARAFGAGGSKSAWAIVLSFPLDILIAFFMWGGHRTCSCCGARRKDEERLVNTGDGCESADEEMVTPTSEEGAVRNLAEEMQRCSEVNDTEAAEVMLNVPKVSKRRSAGELKAWMQKQREQCEVVAENTQALVVTDAKAPEHGEAEGRQEGHLRGNGSPLGQVLPLSPSQQSNKPNRKSVGAGELKALMEKKRVECNVVESAQEFIATDAKAPNKENAEQLSEAPCNNNEHKKSPTSNRELQAWMLQKREQCEVLGGTEAQ